MAEENEFLKAAQGVLSSAQKVAADVVDKVGNIAESATGKDLDKDGSVGSEESDKIVADVKAAAIVAAEMGKEAAGIAVEKGKLVASVAAEKGKEAAAVAVVVGKEVADKAGAAIQGALKKDAIVIPAENVEELPVDSIESADGEVVAEKVAEEAAADSEEVVGEAVNRAAEEASGDKSGDEAAAVPAGKAAAASSGNAAPDKAAEAISED